MTVKILAVFTKNCKSLLSPLPVVFYFDSLQVQDQARFHKESEMIFLKECEMRGPSNPTKASKIHSLKNSTLAKSRIPCQIQEGTKVEKGKLCCVVCVLLTVKL